MLDMTTRALNAENALKQFELSKMKWIAAGLLGLATLLYILGKVLEWSYLVAFAEAAMIGALADWFAVVALFRHPLGLPIPHTAIIPKNKQSIADGLADFIVTQFLSETIIRQRLQSYDAAQHLAQWLAEGDHHQQVSRQLSRAVGYGVQALDDQRIHATLVSAVRNKLQAVDLSGLMVSGLALVTANNSHHKILHGGLNRLADYLDAPENNEKITAFIKGWSDNSFVQSMIEPFAPKIRESVARKLREAAEDESNALYVEFNAQVQNYIARLQSDEALRARLDEQKNAWLNHAEFGRQIESLWEDLRHWVVLDLSHPDSLIQSKMTHLVTALESNLVNHEELRAWLNDQIQAALIQTVHTQKHRIGDWVKEEITQWDDRYMVDRLELYLGKDLQFIRINGTLVGGLFGVLIYVVTGWLT